MGPGGQARGIELRPVVLGPVSLLLLSKAGHVPGETEFDTLSLLDQLLPFYEELFEILAKRGSTCVQLDEPCFTGERTPAELAAFEKAYNQLAKAPLRPRILVTGQYGDFGEALRILAASNVEAIGLDLASYRMQPEELAAIPGIKRKRIYAGVISGRNVWRADRVVTLNYLNSIAEVCPDLVVSTGTTLLHVPYDVLAEYDIEGNVADRLAFAKQKVGEVVSLAKALTEGPSENWRKRPTEVHFKQKHAVRQRVYAVTPRDARTRALRRARGRAAGAVEPAAGARHHARLVPAERQTAPGPPRGVLGTAVRRRLPQAGRGRDRGDDPAAGRHRPRRVRAR